MAFKAFITFWKIWICNFIESMISFYRDDFLTRIIAYKTSCQYFSVLSIDYLNKNNFTGRDIPKFDNIVRAPMFDEDTSIYLPASIITGPPRPGENISVLVTNEPALPDQVRIYRFW